MSAMSATSATSVKPAENKLPGFGLPRHDTKITEGFQRSAFPHALDYDGEGWHSKGVHVREKRMMDFVGQITDKPDWQTKVFDETIVAKWRAEAKAVPPLANGDVYMSDAMFDYCIAELRDKAPRAKETGFVNTLDAELTVTKSDTAVSDDLAAALRKLVAVLEDVPSHKQDWHPGSDNKVLDLVHPSLFPVVLGLTRALRFGTVPLDDCIEYTGKGDVIEGPKKARDDADDDDDGDGDDDEDDEYSESSSEDEDGYRKPKKNDFMDLYQWLPSDVVLDGSAGAKITSYINNLHPSEHCALYGVLEKFVDAAVPLWEECLSKFHDDRRYKLTNTDDEEDYHIPAHLKYDVPPAAEGTDPDDYKYSDEYQEWWRENRVLTWRDPDAYVPIAEREAAAKAAADKKTPSTLEDQPNKRKPRVNLRDPARYPKGLQVIFKLANIHLTPDGSVTVEEEEADDDDDDDNGSAQKSSKYYGGAWHVEGTLAERICATALYYYDEENITPSSLAFRTPLDSEELAYIPAQDAYSSLMAYLGVDAEGPAVTELGSVLTRPGRLLAFPNVMQHRVGSFQLRDPTKPGHRKILAMFLVDPNRRILSTSVVPPQRKDWWADRLLAAGEASATNANDNNLSKLPAELFDHAIDMVDEFPISWDEALAIRKKLMEKRGRFVKDQNKIVKNATFSFCEH